jgi:hypothetical protein
MLPAPDHTVCGGKVASRLFLNAGACFEGAAKLVKKHR